MDAHYSVTADPARGLVLFRLAGFFTEADVEGLRETCLREYARLGPDRHHHATLVDISATEIQSQEALARFAGLLAEPGLQGARLAFVVPLSLARSQVRRIAGDRQAGFFDTVAAAEAWLADDPASRAA